ncbi:MAG: hypothetical protein E7050_08620 [Lentisphaerae bacterium]|nr:hypothetical protein [Lentisphaerota bacterium]
MYGADKAPESSLHRLCSMRSQQLATLDKLWYGLLRTCTDTYGQLGTARSLHRLKPASTGSI